MQKYNLDNLLEFDKILENDVISWLILVIKLQEVNLINQHHIEIMMATFLHLVQNMP